MFRKIVLPNIDNIRVKNKLLLLYLICVFIPIIVINSIFYLRIYESVKERETDEMKQTMERIRSNIVKDIKESFAMANSINADVTFNNYLDKKYSNEGDYAQAYHEYLKSAILKFIPAYSQIAKINAFTDNHTITNSTGITLIDDKIRNSEWYGKITASKSSILVHASLERSSYFEKKSTRYISILVKLVDFKKINFKEKLLKIDINPRMIVGIGEEQKEGTRFFLTDPSGQIVYATDKLYDNDQLQGFTYINDVETAEDSLVMTEDFGSFPALSGWRILGAFNDRKMFHALSEARNFSGFLTIISLLVATFFILIVSRSFSKRVKIVSNHMRKLRKQDFEEIDCFEGGDEIGDLIREFNRMTVKIKSLIRDVYEASIQKQRLELEKQQCRMNALQSQINPHFLFNTLESIRMDCFINDERKAAQILKLMSKTFRRMLEWEEDLVGMQEEISFLDDFFQIQQFRFEEKLQYAIRLDENARGCLIPKMTFQPLVENAVVHGIREKKGVGRVEVEVRRIEGSISCEIRDNGIGMPRYKLEKIRDGLGIERDMRYNIGIRNVYSRLALFFGGNVVFDIQSEEGKGTTISFTIPALDKDKEEPCSRC